MEGMNKHEKDFFKRAIAYDSGGDVRFAIACDGECSD